MTENDCKGLLKCNYEVIWYRYVVQAFDVTSYKFIGCNMIHMEVTSHNT